MTVPNTTNFATRLARKGWIVDGILFALLVVLIAAIAVGYTRSERFFYFWDFGGFGGVAIGRAVGIVEAPRATLRTIWHSVNSEYNDFFTLPLIPLILVLGKSRIGYILSVALVYNLPFVLTLGAIARKLVQKKPHLAFWGTAFLASIFPEVWAPIVRGYPDTGGALLIALAVFVTIQDVELKHWWQVIGLGVLLALSILFRRHFAYGAIALLGAVVLLGGIRFIPPSRAGFRQVFLDGLWLGLRVGGVVMVSGLVLALLGGPFLVRVLTTNYSNLYASYMLPISQVGLYFIQVFGWGIWLLMVLGYGLGILTHVLERRITLFLALFGSLSILQWLLVVRQEGTHYSLHVTLFVVLGIAALGLSLGGVRNHGVRVLAGTALVGIMVLNTVLGLTTIQAPPGVNALFSLNYPPLIRKDYDEVVRLVSYLRNEVPEGAPIYVVDSSIPMNYDLLIKAEQALYGINQSKLNIFMTPQVDSRDMYPLELLIQAQYVIVTTPFQHHLRPEEQKVVEVAFKAFTENWEFARDFIRLPEQFQLSDGAVLSIYRRVNPTSLETALATFNQMRTYIGRQPGGQLEWMLASWHFYPYLQKDAQGIFYFSVDPLQRNDEPDALLLYTGSIPPQGTVEGYLTFGEKECVGVALGVQTFDANLKEIGNIQEKMSAGAGERAFSFTFGLPETTNASDLLFYVRSTAQSYPADICSFSIHWAMRTTP